MPKQARQEGWKTVCVKVPPEMHAALMAVARSENVSISDVWRRIVAHHFRLEGDPVNAKAQAEAQTSDAVDTH